MGGFCVSRVSCLQNPEQSPSAPLPRAPQNQSNSPSPSPPDQVEKAIKTRKAKVVLLAPNISSIVAEPAPAASAAEGSDSTGRDAGGDAAGGASGSAAAECPAEALIALAAEKEVPVVFALSRQRMGKVRRRRLVGLAGDAMGCT